MENQGGKEDKLFLNRKFTQTLAHTALKLKSTSNVSLFALSLCGIGVAMESCSTDASGLWALITFSKQWIHKPGKWSFLVNAGAHWNTPWSAASNCDCRFTFANKRRKRCTWETAQIITTKALLNRNPATRNLWSLEEETDDQGGAPSREIPKLGSTSRFVVCCGTLDVSKLAPQSWVILSPQPTHCSFQNLGFPCELALPA